MDKNQSFIYKKIYIYKIEHEEFKYLGSSVDYKNAIRTHINKFYNLKNSNKIYEYFRNKKIFLEKQHFYLIDEYDNIENKTFLKIFKEMKNTYKNNTKKEIIRKTEEEKKQQLAEYKRTYYINNMDKIKNEYENNKIEILKKAGEKVSCDVCNCEIRKDEYTKHKNNFNKITNINNNITNITNNYNNCIINNK